MVELALCGLASEERVAGHVEVASVLFATRTAKGVHRIPDGDVDEADVFKE